MDLRTFYNIIGGDYDELIKRLMNENIVRKFVIKFAMDPTYDNLMQAMKNGDAENAFLAAHTLKGICVNLNFTGLLKASSELTEQLRGKQRIAETVSAEQVTKEYENIIEQIHKLEGGSI